MDTFIESSWYMLRYACPTYDKAPVDREAVQYWLPVDQYIGGIEHAVGHLIYCRYFTKVMRDLGFMAIDEPVANLMTQGMVYKDGAKMSKSKGNVVDPDDMIARYGADTVRIFMLFASPPEKDLEWSDQGLDGAHRFLLRLWRLIAGCLERGQFGKGSEEMERWRHRTIKRVTEDIERFHFNTAIAALMEYVNFLYGADATTISKEAIETLVLLASPFAPHLAEELWEAMGRKQGILAERWPAFDAGKIATSTVTVVVQVNGKLRDKIEVAADADADEVKARALACEKVVAALGGKVPRNVVCVPGKLVNIVV
jgi:leucyl-tRNA synthetase